MKETLFSLDHGGEIAVPPAWKRRDGSLLETVYRMSSLFYTLSGILLLLVWTRDPSSRLYEGEWAESIVWMVQGIASYLCDWTFLGVKSVTHPLDRSLSLLFTFWNVGKFVFFFSSLTLFCRVLFPTFISAGLVCFHNSSSSVLMRKREEYFFWHSVWHSLFPACSLLFYGSRIQG